MRNAKAWFEKLKTSSDDWGHGDTMHGQMKIRETKSLIDKITKMKSKASSINTLGVLPRWAGEIRRSILLLPPVSKLENLSMYELGKLSKKVENIENAISIHRVSRLKEIIGDANNP